MNDTELNFDRKPQLDMATPRGIQIVASLEAAKGALVLLAGFGVFALLHHDAQHAADRIVHQFHLNPAHRYPRIFLHLLERATPAHLGLLAGGALGYALVRFVEACGLWRERAWAEWLAVASGSIYVPLELWELGKRITWPRALLLTVNLAIVTYLALRLIRRQSLRAPEDLFKA